MLSRLNYGPRLKDFAFSTLENDKSINILEGSVRSGKTWAVMPKILMGCRYPVGGWRIITGASKTTIYGNVLNDLFTLIGPKHYNYNHQSGFLRLFNTKWMVLGANDEGSEKYIRGRTVGLAICDELTLMPLGFYQMLRTRMSPEGARLYATTNCDTPKHWVKELVIDNPEVAKQGLLQVLHCTMDDNPNLPEEYKQSQKAQYSGLFYERYILGRWVMAEGAIYRDAWDDSLLFDDDSVPIGLKNAGGHTDHWVSVDAGVDHPQVYLEFYDDGNLIWCTNRYCWDSNKEMRQKTDGQYADDLIKFMGPNNACQVIVPPEAASLKAEFSARGLWVTDANNEVLEGIQTVSGLMTKRKLRIHKKKCAGLVTGLQLHAWDPKAALRGIEQPLKVDDDDPDAFRYGLHEKIPRWRFM